MDTLLHHDGILSTILFMTLENENRLIHKSNRSIEMRETVFALVKEPLKAMYTIGSSLDFRVNGSNKKLAESAPDNERVLGADGWRGLCRGAGGVDTVDVYRAEGCLIFMREKREQDEWT